MEPKCVTEEVNLKKMNDEFCSFPCNGAQLEAIDDVRAKLDVTLDFIANRIPPQNARYLSIVKTKLEEACMFAVKGISKP